MVCSAILLLTLLIGCTPGVYHHLYGTDPWTEAMLSLKNGQIDEATSRLKPLLRDSSYACQAALYLCIFDRDRKEYLKVINSEACISKRPGDRELLEHLLSTEKGLQQLRSKNQDLKEEVARLRFELEKMEEIRHKAEKWQRR